MEGIRLVGSFSGVFGIPRNILLNKPGISRLLVWMKFTNYHYEALTILLRIKTELRYVHVAEDSLKKNWYSVHPMIIKIHTELTFVFFYYTIT